MSRNLTWLPQQPILWLDEPPGSESNNYFQPGFTHAPCSVIGALSLAT